MIYPNQRFIEIHKETVAQSKATGRLYLIEYQDNIINACKDLSSSAFKVYIALILNKNLHRIDYSPEYIHQLTGLCRATAKKALVELEEKNYLIQKDAKHYDFFDYPIAYIKNNNSFDDGERRCIIDEYTGELYRLTYKELRQKVNENQANKLWQEAKKYDL